MCRSGDCLTIRLTGKPAAEGTAWLRTNLGRGDVRIREVLAHAEKGKAILDRDWHDVPMTPVEKDAWTVTLPLTQIGCFQAKAFFDSTREKRVFWPAGDNLVVKVEPAETLRGNSIYTVFPRQFGPDKGAEKSSRLDRAAVEKLDKRGYTVIPPSGTFRDIINELDFIMGTLGARIIQLLPVHPVPVSYGRMGRYGSPFAATDFFTVDPALAVFDKAATPLDQFRELTDAVHARRGRVFIDLPANHTGWASHLQTHHPEWFTREENGDFHSPGAWGVVWADLCELDYRQRGLWKEMADVFLFWCRQGVDGFRCDAGYMVPEHVWRYVAAKVRAEFPNCVFMLEGLGGPIKVMKSLLTDGSLNWAYSELFQTETKPAFEHYLPGCNDIARHIGTLAHFAETHDNNRLAATSPAYAKMRTALCALFSHGGTFGFTNGVEWLATEKIDVHGAAALNWGSPENQVDHIRRLLTILEHHPAFHMGVPQTLIHSGDTPALALKRGTSGTSDAVLVLVNLDVNTEREIRWSPDDFAVDGGLHDLISAEVETVKRTRNGYFSVMLPPGRVACLSPDPVYVETIARENRVPVMLRERSLEQRQREIVLKVWGHVHGFGDVGSFDVTAAARLLAESGPEALCQSLGAADGEPAPRLPLFSRWEYPADIHRTVPVPPGKMVLVVAPHHFSVKIRREDRVARYEHSLPAPDGTHFALLDAVGGGGKNQRLGIDIALYGDGTTRRQSGSILVLRDGGGIEPVSTFAPDRFNVPELYALQANELGGYAQTRAAWSHLESQYDAFLAVNDHPDFPVDRRVMLRRFRVWSVHRDYSQELGPKCQTQFRVAADGCPVWSFDVPVGQGVTVGIDIAARLSKRGNHARVTLSRIPAARRAHCLQDTEPVRLIIRPDVEDRSAHEVTRAMAGPEHAFPAAVKPMANGFSFNPGGERNLILRADGAAFTTEPEWLYMVSQPFEEHRGLSPHTDVFSPGYFHGLLTGDGRMVIDVSLGPVPVGIESDHEPDPVSNHADMEGALRRAIAAFIVKRDQFKTVIAGYPWFLDWGRDTLICLRGIQAAGFARDCRDILIQFARFEKAGTLPNMIRGDDESNRDTSDAPLWLLVACADYVDGCGDRAVLAEDCGGRTLLDALTAVAEGYVAGTPNGIKVDPESGLVYSPSHFTWMDTNHPAGTPRQGYPVEIQALWIAGLRKLAEWTGDKRWADRADHASASLRTLYVKPGQDFLSDCLHCEPGVPAARAVADDHCRPNQLLAVTLGAVTDRELARNILRSCECLLVPGGIRSLADRPVTCPLPVWRDGKLLNNPDAPYRGRYEGDEDTRRKPAYHNGTAWSWQFPLYPEALLKVYGEDAKATALALLMSSCEVMNTGCVGHIPEIMDGDAPHAQRGCGAQAWGVTELYRVWKILSG
ncbi:MAG: amylo-alpha-1,6-glucosidase [Lentisphaeria bacterium]|nr:amylo-alpha-1,6-glucosidase [Lentisphaeria bacterium]